MNEFLFQYNNKEFTANDLHDAFKEAGIGTGDKLFIHSDLRSFGRVNPNISQEEYLGAFVEVLTDLVGENGVVIMPTFSYSFGRGEIYDPQNTPSTVGSLTEYFRKLPNVVRTIDPILSVAIWGDNKGSYVNVGTDCFGEGSIFQKIYNEDFKIMFLGETFDMTYLHFVEQSFKVPYRYIKKFTGQIKAEYELKEYTFDYYARDLDQDPRCDLEKIASSMSGVLRSVRLGFSQIRVVSAKDAYSTIFRMLEKDKFALLTEESKKELIKH